METQYEYEKYLCTKETLKETIEKYGAAIIPNVLDEDECEKMVSGMWDFLEQITSQWDVPLNRNDDKTWRQFYKLFPLHSMLLQHFSVGHAQASWDLRQNPKIVEIFAYFWKCTQEELLVSFDGFSFGLPPEKTNKGWNRNNVWYHTDQSYTTPDFKCIQSWVTGLDVNTYDATLSIMEGSNKYHGEFKERFGVTDKANWYKLKREEEEFYIEKGCEYKNIKCPKGCIVFWDSRTIHCGVEATKKREKENLRAVIYLCYMPRKLCCEKNLKKKQKAFEELRTTNHYPCDIKLFAKSPRTYGAEIEAIKSVDKPVLTELGRKLAGF